MEALRAICGDLICQGSTRIGTRTSGAPLLFYGLLTIFLAQRLPWYVLFLQGVLDRDLLPDTTKTIKFEGRLLRLYLGELT